MDRGDSGRTTTASNLTHLPSIILRAPFKSCLRIPLHAVMSQIGLRKINWETSAVLLLPRPITFELELEAEKDSPVVLAL